MRAFVLSLMLFLCGSIALPSLFAQLPNAKWWQRDSTDIPAVVTISPDNRYVGVQTAGVGCINTLLYMNTADGAVERKKSFWHKYLFLSDNTEQYYPLYGLEFGRDARYLVMTNYACVVLYDSYMDTALVDIPMRMEFSGFGVGDDLYNFGKPLLVRKDDNTQLLFTYEGVERRHHFSDTYIRLTQPLALDGSVWTFQNKARDIAFHHEGVDAEKQWGEEFYAAKLSSSNRYIMGKLDEWTTIRCSEWGNMPCRVFDTTAPHRFYGNAGYAMTKDDKRIAIGSNDSVIIYSTETRAILQVLRHQGKARVWEFSDNDSRLISYDEGRKRVLVWDVAQGTIIHQFDSLPAPLTSLSLSADGRLMAIGLKDGTVALYDGNTITAVNDESKDFAEEQGISVFPQPVTSHCTIKGIAADVQEIVVYNLLGECVYRLHHPASVLELPVTALEADGVYSVCALSPRGIERCSIVVSR